MRDHDGRHDFDLWMGEWRTHNRRLVKRDGGLLGMSLRLFNPDERTWAISRSSTRPLGHLLEATWVTNWIADPERGRS